MCSGVYFSILHHHSVNSSLFSLLCLLIPAAAVRVLGGVDRQCLEATPA
jgi:hypothetical protein